MEFFNLVAGVLLILFGLRFLRKGFARIMSGDLLDWLQGFTRTRSRALVGGAAGGAVMPSSTAMALVSVQMTRRGRVSWENVFAVLLGAQLGTTVLVQVISFELQDYAGLFVAIGGVLFLFTQVSRVRGIGQSLLAFGFILLGMGLLSQAGAAAAGDPAIVNLFAALGELPQLFFFGAVLLTLLVQSATASIAVALALVGTGHVGVEMLMLWVLGANIGLCLTVLVAGWARAEGRRLGVAALLLKAPLAIILAVILLALPAGLLAGLPGTLPQQAAWTHTLFNLIACAGVLLARPLGNWMVTLVPEPPSTSPIDRATVRLDSNLLQNPTLALNAASREALQIIDGLHMMRSALARAIRDATVPPNLESDMDQGSRQLRRLGDELVRYLDEIPDDALGRKSQTLKDAIDDFTRELPIILRILGRDQVNGVKRLLTDHPESFEAARPLLTEATSRLSRQIESVARMLMRERPKLARDIIERKQKNSQWLIRAKREHSHLPHALWKMLDDFQQLNRRLSSVAYVYGRDLSDSERSES